jgi:hypothetical protein
MWNLLRDRRLGGQHNGNPKDEVRTAWLESRGYRVLRFWNNEVLTNPEGVLMSILLALNRSPSPPPTNVGLRRREGEGGDEGSTGLSAEDSR